MSVVGWRVELWSCHNIWVTKLPLTLPLPCHTVPLTLYLVYPTPPTYTHPLTFDHKHRSSTRAHAPPPLSDPPPLTPSDPPSNATNIRLGQVRGHMGCATQVFLHNGTGPWGTTPTTPSGPNGAPQSPQGDHTFPGGTGTAPLSSFTHTHHDIPDHNPTSTSTSIPAAATTPAAFATATATASAFASTMSTTMQQASLTSVLLREAGLAHFRALYPRYTTYCTCYSTALTPLSSHHITSTHAPNILSTYLSTYLSI